MRRTLRVAAAVCCAACLAVGAGAETVAESGVKAAPLPGRKSPSHFHRPAKNTPAEQLAYANALRDGGRPGRAAAQYSLLVRTWHDSSEAPAAQFEYARLMEKAGDYDGAFEEYDYLIRNFFGGFPYNDVLDSQFRIANHVMTSRTRFLWVFPTADNLDRALPMFERIVLNGPHWEKTAQAQFNVGWIHQKDGSYEEAVSAYETCRQNYPGTAFAADAAFGEAHCLYLLALRSAREERGLSAARSSLNRFLADYPDHESAGEAAKFRDDVVSRIAAMTFERAVFYDRRNLQPRSALIAYRDFAAKFPESGKAEIARKRIAELQAQTGAEPDAASPVEEPAGPDAGAGE